MTQYSDQLIIQTAGIDPRRALAMLMHRFKEPVYWHIRRIVVNHCDAEDASQEAFLKLYRFMDSLQQVSNLRAWVFRIATNEALRLLQMRAPAAVSLDDDGARESFSICADEYFDYSNLEAVALTKAIDLLPQKQKLIFSLRYFNELPYQEIAIAVNTSVASAKVLYHLARAKVTKYLKNKVIN